MRLRNIPRAGSVLAECPFVIKQETEYKGNWAAQIFASPGPIHLEIGMGKGQFLLSLAEQNPDINYIGIERYSSVLLRAVEKLEQYRKERENAFSNLRFICMSAENLAQVFAPQEIERIYLNFSDPWPKARHAGRRLTSPQYFERYDRILSQNGQIEFKTDNRSLFQFSVSVLNESSLWEVTACTYDLHHDAAMNAGNIMTEYEERFSSMNHPICKLITKRKTNPNLP